jgi:hypothetical protein
MESDDHLARSGYGVRALLQPQGSLELFKNECFHLYLLFFSDEILWDLCRGVYRIPRSRRPQAVRSSR